MSDSIPSLSEKIPELHYDVIARMIPGMLALAVYIGHLKPFPTDFASLVVLAALSYVVGFAVEQLANHALDLRIWNPICKRLHANLRFIPMPNSDVWEHRNTTNGPRNTIIFKMLAERSLFRSFILLSLIALFKPPYIAGDQRCMVFGVLAISIHTFYWLSRWLSWQVKTDRDLLAKQKPIEL